MKFGPFQPPAPGSYHKPTQEELERKWKDSIFFDDPKAALPDTRVVQNVHTVDVTNPDPTQIIHLERFSLAGILELQGRMRAAFANENIFDEDRKSQYVHEFQGMIDAADAVSEPTTGQLNAAQVTLDQVAPVLQDIRVHSRMLKETVSLLLGEIPQA